MDRPAAASLPALDGVLNSGYSIAYREAGQGAPVLLLHGIGSGSESWQIQFATLSSTFRLIAWDKPGYGGSAPLARHEATNADYAHAVAALLDGLEIDALNVVGHSLGSLIAASFARLYPRRVVTLTLASPATGYGNDDEATRSQKLHARLQPLMELSADERAKTRSAELLTPNADERAFEIVRSVMRNLRVDGYRQAAMMASRSDIFFDAPHISARTLVTCGSLDKVTSIASSRRVSAAISDATFVELSNVGHACYLEDPTAFNNVLLDFLDIGHEGWCSKAT